MITVIPRITLADLPSTSRSRLEEIAEGVGMVLSYDLRIDSIGTIKALAASGFGYAVLPRTAVADEISQGLLDLSRIVEPDVTLDLSLVISRRSEVGSDIYGPCGHHCRSDRSQSPRGRLGRKDHHLPLMQKNALFSHGNGTRQRRRSSSSTLAITTMEQTQITNPAGGPPLAYCGSWTGVAKPILIASKHLTFISIDMPP